MTPLRDRLKTGGLREDAVYETEFSRLCRLRRADKVPSPLAPVLDHVIPLALGGKHEPRNVQCAHFLCNSQKSSQIRTSQLRLVG